MSFIRRVFGSVGYVFGDGDEGVEGEGCLRLNSLWNGVDGSLGSGRTGTGEWET